MQGVEGRRDASGRPNLLDNQEVFLQASATVAFALRAVADAVRTRQKNFLIIE
jgi:hypothetical protein